MQPRGDFAGDPADRGPRFRAERIEAAIGKDVAGGRRAAEAAGLFDECGPGAAARGRCRCRHACAAAADYDHIEIIGRGHRGSFLFSADAR